MEQLRSLSWKVSSVFKTNIFKFIRPSSNSVYNFHNTNKRICYFTIYRLGLSHLREHKFKHGFQDTIDQLFAVGMM